MADEPVLSAAEIARSAGVTRATVLSWRRRHADFPASVAETGPRLAFDRAETEAWLAGNGRLEVHPGPGSSGRCVTRHGAHPGRDR